MVYSKEQKQNKALKRKALMQQVKTFLNQLKTTLVESKKTLAPFKWSIGFYVLLMAIIFNEWINPPHKDDQIFKAEETSVFWNYTNQDVYVGAIKLECIIVVLIFFLALSNIKNHPRLARLILLSPWILLGLGLIKMLIYWLFSLV